MNTIKISVLACFLLFVNNNMQAQEPCWFTKPPTCKNPNFVYAAGVGIGNAEKIRYLAEADALRRYAAEVTAVDIPDVTYQEVLEKGLRNAKIAGLPAQYRVVRQKLENNNYYTLLLLPKRFSTDPRSINYPIEELCDRNEGIGGNTYETTEIGESSQKIGFEKPTDLEFVVTEDGYFTISLKTRAEILSFALYNKNGIQLMPIENKNKITAGSIGFSNRIPYIPYEYLLKLSKTFADCDKVINCLWSPTNIFEGSFTFMLNVGTYYIRFIRSDTGIDEVRLTTKFEAVKW